MQRIDHDFAQRRGLPGGARNNHLARLLMRVTESTEGATRFDVELWFGDGESERALHLLVKNAAELHLTDIALDGWTIPGLSVLVFHDRDFDDAGGSGFFYDVDYDMFKAKGGELWCEEAVLDREVPSSSASVVDSHDASDVTLTEVHIVGPMLSAEPVVELRWKSDDGDRILLCEQVENMSFDVTLPAPGFDQLTIRDGDVMGTRFDRKKLSIQAGRMRLT